MNTKATVEANPLDTVKLILALGVLVGGLVAFHHYADAPKLARVGGIVAAVGVAAGLVALTDKGRLLIGFLRDAQIEVRKVVWPTRQETTQTTIVVMVVVELFAFLLWLLDLALGGLVQLIIGRGA